MMWSLKRGGLRNTLSSRGYQDWTTKTIQDVGTVLDQCFNM